MAVYMLDIIPLIRKLTTIGWTEACSWYLYPVMA